MRAAHPGHDTSLTRASASLTAPPPVEHVAPDAALAHDIGMLVPATRAAGLSLGDRACLALARRLGVTALTAERRWADVAGVAGVEVRLIR